MCTHVTKHLEMSNASVRTSSLRKDVNSSTRYYYKPRGSTWATGTTKQRQAVDPAPIKPGFTSDRTDKRWGNQSQNIHKRFLHSTKSKQQLEPRPTVFTNITKQYREESMVLFNPFLKKAKTKTSENQNTMA